MTRDLDFDLPHPDGLDHDPRLADRVEHAHGLRGREREPAEVAARGHGPDEDAGIGRMTLHADAVTEDRTAAERARRIDREHPDFLAGRAQPRDELVGQSRLPGTGRTCDADRPRVAGARVQHLDRDAGTFAAPFDE